MARGMVMPGDMTTSGHPPLFGSAGASARAYVFVFVFVSVSGGRSFSWGNPLRISADSCGVTYGAAVPFVFAAGYQRETLSSRDLPSTQGSGRWESTRWTSGRSVRRVGAGRSRLLSGRRTPGAGDGLGSSPNVLILGGALVGLPLVAGLWSHARRQVLAAMREQAEQLVREQVLRAEQARAQERARIAREMHDVVAHRVSLMVLHAGALQVGAPDERTAQAAALIGDVGREALSNLREVLGVLRSPDASRDPQPTLADLDRLLAQSRDLGLVVDRRDEGPVRTLGQLILEAAGGVVIVGEARDGEEGSARPPGSGPRSCSWTCGCPAWTA